MGKLREEMTRRSTSLIAQYVVFSFLSTSIYHGLGPSSLVEKALCFGEEL